ncbi:MAG: hypothetical protein QG622_2202 [Actinomycetota bacterium]|nr:hypothetical protein [Actinomycetota bacterium]
MSRQVPPTAWRPALRRRVAVRALARRDGESGAAMLFVVMCMLIAMMLSTALLGVVLSDTVPTAYEAKAARTLHAAESGLQAGMSALRSAKSAQPGLGLIGDLTMLPCYTTASPLTGTMSGGSGPGADVSYTVTVRYFTIDPARQTKAWRASNALGCIPGTGPSEPPLYALIESRATGSGGAGMSSSLGNRAVEVVYGFQATDSGTLGGPIAGNSGLCWAAPSVTPSPGDQLRLQPCDDESVEQQFAYRADYGLVLAITQSSSAPGSGGMCVDASTGGQPGDDVVTARNNDLNLVNVTTGASGPFSGSTAVSLNGSNARMNATLNEPDPGPAPFTVTTRFKTTAEGMILSYNNKIDTTGNTYDRHLYMDSSGRITFGVSHGGRKTVRSPLGYDNGAWHTVTASLGAAGQRLYVDGALVASGPETTAQAYAGYWHLGWGKRGTWPNTPSSDYWNGSLAHAAVWSRQLTDGEVTSLTSGVTTDAGARNAVTARAPRSYWPLGGSATPEVTFQACDASNGQKWSYNDNGQFEALRPDGTGLWGRCLAGQNPSQAGTRVVLVNCSSAHTWTPDPTVGAGAAGASTFQFVNYHEYGRCLDVTNQNVNWDYLITYPCKQDPSHPVTWNQRWIWDTVSRQFQTSPSATTYCLTLPSSPSGYVTTEVCSSYRTDQRWTANNDTGSRTTSYTLVGSDGRCLDLVTVAGNWSRLVMNSCSGAFSQKWNAPPAYGSGGVLKQRETTRE